MVVLDTDHVSFLERQDSTQAARLLRRLSSLSRTEVATTIITYEEQTRGWLAYAAKSRTIAQQIEAYRQLHKHLNTYRDIVILDFNEPAAVEYQRLRKSAPRVGSYDLKIAAIVRSKDALLLTRNLRDFRQISDLQIEDWTA